MLKTSGRSSTRGRRTVSGGIINCKYSADRTTGLFSPPTLEVEQHEEDHVNQVHGVSIEN
jgi:hypothetical protein